MSKQLGILFKPEMVRAILEGRKTQTRRGLPIHPTIDQSQLFEPSFDDDNSNLYFRMQVDGKDVLVKPIKCPWQVGDCLYVKETWWQYGHWEHVVPHEGTFEGDTEWKRGAGEIKFFTDYPTAPDITYAGHIKSLWRKMSSLFLAQKDARIWLKVTNVRVERLLDISDDDAIAEGIISHKGVPGEYPSEPMYKEYTGLLGSKYVMSPTRSYFSLWDSINGVGSHQLNPWVWVIEFERCEKP
jgi:hypothetical protein